MANYLFHLQKFVLIHSIFKKFWLFLGHQQYPSHVISFRKQDLLNITIIKSRNTQDDLREVYLNCSSNNFSSKLEVLGKTAFIFFCQIEISLYFMWILDLFPTCYYLKRVRLEGISSLNSLALCLESIEESYFGKQSSLKTLRLQIKNEINNESSTNLFQMCPNIEEMYLYGDFSDINFDMFCNLKKLKLYGNLLDGFNFDLFKNIRIQLEELSIKFENMDDESIIKLLYGRNFPKISSLRICNSKITRLEKKLFDGFPMLQSLKVSHNQELKTIDKDSFSDLKSLKYLHLKNNRLSELDPELFSGLVNFEILYLAANDQYSNIKGFSYPVKISYRHRNYITRGDL